MDLGVRRISMEATVHTPIDERLPAQIHRPGAHALCELVAERFMGVLVHPVPSGEMQELCGTFQPGGKVLVEWPRDDEHWRQVLPGDRLVVGDRQLTIRGIYEYPECYVAIYVDAP
jgi:hypothetical protein